MAIDSHDALCFDLDGTLWDVIPSTLKAWNKISTRYGLRRQPISRAELEGTTGRPIADCLVTLFGNDLPIDATRLIREIEAEEESTLRREIPHFYPGMQTGVATLADRYRLFLVSNCQTWYLNQFFEMSRLQRFFEGWDCHGSAGVSKGEMLRRLKERHAVTNMVYIGDTAGDHEAARASDTTFCFAAWGFGEVPDRDYHVNSFAELTVLFG